jgi:predicted aspartyl protease
MAITNCGFPPYTVVGTPPNVQVISAQQLLHSKGPTTSVEIGFDARMFGAQGIPQSGSLLVPVQGSAIEAAPVAPSAGIPVPQPSLKVVEALIDTGAFDSCIDESLAQELNLPLIDQTDCSGVGGAHKLNVYLGHIRIIGLNYVQFGRFIGAKLKDGRQPHQALLGRSVLQSMILVYDGRTGNVSLAI